MTQLTPSESPSSHEIVVKDQRETIKNAFHVPNDRALHTHSCPASIARSGWRTGSRNLRDFYRTLPIMYSVRIDSAQVFLRGGRCHDRRPLFVAMQDYVRSIGATQTISKAQIFRFLEMQFAHADRNHDGELEIDEVAAFVHAIWCPESDQR